jgi:RNA polymerase sigma-70 factor (ECF subfamily)
MVDSGRTTWRVRSEDDLRVVFEACFAEVYRYAARLAGPDRALAEDVVQEAFVALARTLRAGEVDEINVGWLLVAARNRFIDHVRRRSVASRVVGTLRHAPYDDSEGTGPVWDAVAALSPVQRLALTLHHVDGYSVTEVASIVGKSVRATESVLARGRAAVRGSMGREHSDD